LVPILNFNFRDALFFCVVVDMFWGASDKTISTFDSCNGIIENGKSGLKNGKLQGLQLYSAIFGNFHFLYA
jgi:hypothetical protein